MKLTSALYLCVWAIMKATCQWKHQRCRILSRLKAEGMGRSGAQQIVTSSESSLMMIWLGRIRCACSTLRGSMPLSYSSKAVSYKTIGVVQSEIWKSNPWWLRRTKIALLLSCSSQCLRNQMLWERPTPREEMLPSSGLRTAWGCRVEAIHSKRSHGRARTRSLGVRNIRRRRSARCRCWTESHRGPPKRCKLAEHASIQAWTTRPLCHSTLKHQITHIECRTLSHWKTHARQMYHRVSRGQKIQMSESAMRVVANHRYAPESSPCS